MAMPNIKEKIKLNNFLILALIVFLAGFLRFYQLGKVPAGFHRNEAFLGYNAYSIALFGLNAFAVRFPSAFFGTLTVLLTYFLVKELFPNNTFQVEGLVSKKFLHLGGGVEISTTPARWLLSLIASFLLAISPWHINLCRTATENVIVVFFITLGLLFWFC